MLDVIKKQVCAPPCWQGITPGLTTSDEAWTIALSLVPTDEPASKQFPFSIDTRRSSKYIGFDYQDVWVGLRSDPQGIINEIGFTFNRRYRDEPELQDLIEIYGNPISVDICHELMEIRRAVVWIRYPNMSLYFSEQLPPEGDSFTVHVKKDAGIYAIFYKSKETEFPILDFSFPWRDYDDLTITPEEKNPLSTCP